MPAELLVSDGQIIFFVVLFVVMLLFCDETPLAGGLLAGAGVFLIL